MKCAPYNVFIHKPKIYMFFFLYKCSLLFGSENTFPEYVKKDLIILPLL